MTWLPHALLRPPQHNNPRQTKQRSNISTTGSNKLFSVALLVIPGLFLGACSQESPSSTAIESASKTGETRAETPAVSAETDTERRPNILVIIGDDMGSETLSCTGIGNNPATTPNLAGFDHFSGLIRGFPDSYFAWNQTVNGDVTGTTGYTPDRKVEDAIAWLEKQGDEPWFMWFAFNLPHSPLHLTPEELWQKDRSNLDPQANPNENQQEYFFAMLEAMDGEIGRLLNSMDAETRANTYIMFIGDNGSTRGTLQEPYLATGGKATVYQGGVNVPMIVTGPGVPARTTADALVNSTDFFVSIMELAGIDSETTVPEGITTDSISFVPYLTDPGKESIRKLIYADTFGGNFDGIEDADFAMRDLEYKILRRSGKFEFYYLVDDPFENNNLLLGELNGVQQGRYDKLLANVTDLRETRSHAEPEITLSLK